MAGHCLAPPGAPGLEASCQPSGTWCWEELGRHWGSVSQSWQYLRSREKSRDKNNISAINNNNDNSDFLNAFLKSDFTCADSARTRGNSSQLKEGT